MSSSYTNNAAITPGASEIMRAAYERAWQSPEAVKLAAASASHADWVKETLALRIVERATQGEKDADRLYQDALDHLAKAKPLEPNRETNPFD